MRPAVGLVVMCAQGVPALDQGHALITQFGTGRSGFDAQCVGVVGGWNRIHIPVEDLAAEVKRLRDAGLKFRNHYWAGRLANHTGQPPGNPIELFQSAGNN